MFRLPEQWPGLPEILNSDDIARFLKFSLLFILMLSLSGLVGALFSTEPGWNTVFWNSLALTAASSLAIWLLSRRKVLLAVYLVVIGNGAWLALAAWMGAGVKGITYTALILPILTAALFLGRRAGFLAALASALYGLFLLVAGRLGWLVNADRPISDIFAWFANTASFFIAAQLISISLWQVERALKKVHAEIDERIRSEAEIRRLNIELEQRIAERTAQLAESEERYRLISTVIADYVFFSRVNADNSITLEWTAGAFEKITGYSREEYVERGGWSAALYPEDIEIDQRDMENLRRNQPVVSEVRTIAKNGEVRWVRVYAHPRWDERENRLIGVYGAVQDITERKQAEERMRQKTVQLSVLYQLGQRMSEARNPDEIYAAAYDAAKQLFPLEAFFIALMNEQQKTVEYVYLVDKDRRYPNDSMPFLEHSLTTYVIQTGEMLLAASEDDWNAIDSGSGVYGTGEDTLSLMIAPLRPAGKVIGAISVQHYQLGMYTEEHRQIFMTLANQVATAIRNSLLVQSLRLQAAALDAAASAIVISDEKGIIQWVNPAFTAMTGYSSQEAVGQKTSLLRSGVHSGALYDELWSTLMEGRVWRGELVNRRKDGSLYVEEQVITPVRDEQGQIFRYISIKQDITSRKQSEERETRRREMMEKVIDLGKAVTKMTDPGQCLREIHHSIQKGLGFDRVGLFDYDPVHNLVRGLLGTSAQGRLEDTSWFSEPVSDYEGWVKAVSETRGLHLVEDYSTRHDLARHEDMRGVKQHATLAAWVGEAPVLLIGVDNLITGRQFSEEQLEALQLFAGYAGLAIENAHWNAQLEQRVAERTRQLEAANQELESLAYTIAHDLRIPARAMHGFASILKETEAKNLNPIALRHLERIRNSAKLMGQQVDDLLEYMRIGRVPLRRQTVDMNILVESACASLEKKMTGREIRLQAQNLPPCQGDPSLLRRAWINLLGNAIKFTSSRPLAEIEIGAREVEGKTEYFIRDNGIGFDMKFSDNLFGAFQRLHHPEEYEGTGMGLAIVQRILQRHGGRIWAEAKEGQGATFYFTVD